MQIPKKAKKVFKGIIFDVYQWPQKQFDGSVKTFEALKRLGTVIIVATVRDKIVVLNQRQPGRKPFISMVAGRMDKVGETPRQTAVRELLEEVGMKAGKIRLWEHINKDSHKIDHDIYLFIANNCKQVAEPTPDEGELIKPMLYTFDQFLELWKNPKFIDGEIKDKLILAQISQKYKKELKRKIFG